MTALTELLSKLREAGDLADSTADRELPKLLKIIEVQREALEKYKCGSAFDYDQHTRGEFIFNHSLSVVVACEALAEVDRICEGKE